MLFAHCIFLAIASLNSLGSLLWKVALLILAFFACIPCLAGLYVLSMGIGGKQLTDD